MKHLEIIEFVFLTGLFAASCFSGMSFASYLLSKPWLPHCPRPLAQKFYGFRLLALALLSAVVLIIAIEWIAAVMCHANMTEKRSFFLSFFQAK